MGIFAGDAFDKLGTLLQRKITGAAPAAEAPAVRQALGDGLKLSSNARVALDRPEDVANLQLRLAPDQAGIRGGHVDKAVMLDPANGKWLFKVFEGAERPAGVAETAGSSIFNAIGLKTPTVYASRQPIDGALRNGTLQRIVEHSGQPLPADATKLTATQKDDLLGIQVGRWLIGDHDGKIANHLVMPDGHVQAIDLGNAYRHFPDDQLDRLYAPNPDPEVYKGMWEAYLNGQIDLNFDAGLQQVARVEALPDSQFAALLKPYADARYAAGYAVPGLPTADDFVQAALQRKQNLRADMQNFYRALQNNRAFRARASQGLAGYQFRLAPDQSGVMGGHTPKAIVLDQAGNRWLSKPVPLNAKYRAIAEVSASDVARAAGLDTPEVFPLSQTLHGKPWFGSMQRMTPNSGKAIQLDKLSQTQIDELTQGQVVRWLLSDHDGKLENYLLLDNGHLQAIDFSQMYRFFPGDSLDRLYNPNGTPTAFNQVAERYVKGQLTLDFAKGLDQLDRIDAIPDAQFIDMLRPYAEARYRAGDTIPCYKTADEFLQAALRRKQSLRGDVIGFYDSLAKERGYTGLAEALGPQGGRVQADLQKLGLAPVQALDPNVRALWAQSRSNAQRVRERAFRTLNKQLGSRQAAEQEYAKRLATVKQDTFIAANYPGESLLEAMHDGKLKSLYDLTPQEQLKIKDPAYLQRRSAVDTQLGIKDANPLYVTIGNTPNYSSEVGKYGNVEVRYKADELGPRSLFSDGNHFYYASQSDPRAAYNANRFTWYDAPDLVVSREIAQAANPQDDGRLIEGTVFGGINPLQNAERIKILRHPEKAGELTSLAQSAGIPVST